MSKKIKGLGLCREAKRVLQSETLPETHKIYYLRLSKNVDSKSPQVLSKVRLRVLRLKWGMFHQSLSHSRFLSTRKKFVSAHGRSGQRFPPSPDGTFFPSSSSPSALAEIGFLCKPALPEILTVESPALPPGPLRMMRNVYQFQTGNPVGN